MFSLRPALAPAVAGQPRRWPVGEEWLYQSWAASYLPVIERAETPCRRGPHRPADARRHPGARRPARRSALPRQACTTGWATGSCAPTRPRCAPAGDGASSARASTGRRARAAATSRRAGATAARRSCGALVDAGTVELLGGPAGAPVPAAARPAAARAVRCARASPTRGRGWGRTPDRHLGARVRLHARAWRPVTTPPGSRTSWSTAPRCAATPPSAARSAIPTCVAFGRDLHVSYRVWSPQVRLSRARRVPRLPHLRPRHRPQAAPGDRHERRRADKAPYDPDARRRRGRQARRRLRRHRPRAAAPRVRADRAARAGGGRVRHRTVRPLVARGPAAGSSSVLRALPEAGVTGRHAAPTPRGAATSASRVELADQLMGSGKDWRVWDGAQVARVRRAQRRDHRTTALATWTSARRRRARRDVVVAIRCCGRR